MTHKCNGNIIKLWTYDHNERGVILARPPKWRKVEFIPGITYFKPAGVPLNQLKEVVLTIDELEAIRLRDIEDLEQEDCAKSMGISRATFSRVLNSARAKIANALIEGMAIRIEGGNYKFSGKLRCQSCGRVWRENYTAQDDKILECPECSSQDLKLAKNGPCRYGKRKRGRWKGI